jgi:hypothetical protein
VLKLHGADGVLSTAWAAPPRVTENLFSGVYFVLHCALSRPTVGNTQQSAATNKQAASPMLRGLRPVSGVTGVETLHIFIAER